MDQVKILNSDTFFTLKLIRFIDKMCGTSWGWTACLALFYPVSTGIQLICWKINDNCFSKLFFMCKYFFAYKQKIRHFSSNSKSYIKKFSHISKKLVSWKSVDWSYWVKRNSLVGSVMEDSLNSWENTRFMPIR